MIITWNKAIRSLKKHLKLEEGNKFFLSAKVNSWNIKIIEDLGFSMPLKTGEILLPNPNVSIFSKYNVFWKEIIDKLNREIVKREIPYDINDWRWNPHSWTYFKDFNRYKREIIWDFNMELSTVDINWDQYIIVDREFEYTEDQETEILFAINLMLSIFGEARVLSENLELLDTTNYTKVNWRLLPLWESPFDTIKSVVEGRYSTEYERVPMLERQKFMKSLNPDEVFIWEWGFNDYFAYSFKSKGITILESMEYWNALYIFDSNWKVLSKKTKKEILTGWLEKERIVHYPNYTRRVLTYFS